MKNLILLTLLTLVSCSKLLPIQRHQISVNEIPKPATPRSFNYLQCVKELSREGIKQSLIKELCDASFGSLD